MLKKKKLFSRKVLICGIFALGMAMLGVSYAAWNSELGIDAQVTTGMMNILFYHRSDAEYRAALTDAEGNERTPIDVSFTVANQGKLAEISFQNGLPIEELLNGQMIKIEFPIKPDEESTVVNIDSVELDMTKTPKDEKRIEMKPEGAMIIVNRILYFLKETPQEFMFPISFDAYHIIDVSKPDNIKGAVYLKLREESKQKLEALPKDFVTNRKNLEDSAQKLDFGKIDLKKENGIVVMYSCEISLYIDQKEVELQEEIGILQ